MRPRRWAVAALAVGAIVLVAGIAVAVARSDDGGTPGPRWSDLDADNAEPGSGPTGWYLPTDLPEGWAVDAVEVVEPEPATRVRLPDDDPERPCACEAATWVSPDGTQGITATMQPGSDVEVLTDQYGSLLDTEPADFDWVEGVIGRPAAGGGDDGEGLRIVAVSDGTRVLQVAGAARDQETMQTMATTWIQAGLEDLLGDIGSPEGWTLHSLGAGRLESHEPFVRVSLTTPDGPAHYDLVPTGTRPFLPGAGGDVRPDVGRDDLGPTYLDAATGAARISAQGADVVVGAVERDGPTQDEVNEVLIRSLGPVTASAWQEALADLDHDDRLDQPALARTSQLVATGGAAPTTRIPKDDDTVLHGRNVDGLELSLDLWSTEVVEGEPVGAHVLLRNTTERTIDLNECNDGSFQWGLVRPDETDRTLPYRGYTDCYDSLRSSIPPGSTLRYPTDRGLDTQRPAWMPEDPSGITYGPGTYQAAVALGGSRSTIRTVDPRTIIVDPSTCPPLPQPFRTTDPDGGPVVQTWEDAEAAAEDAGLPIRLLKVGDDPGPVDCKRVTAYASGGNPVVFTRS